MHPIFRLFVDEVGHASMKASEHPNERYLSLTGVIMRLQHEQESFGPALDALKNRIFSTREIVLHRTEIVYRRKPFDCLEDETLRSDFDNGVLELIANASYRVVTVVIDKMEHKRRYLVWQAYPYHYCMTALLERYVLWLQSADSRGDVMAESRGKKDNKKLVESYARLYQRGTDYVSAKMFQQRLTTKELKIREKTANVAGLQLADLIANPCMRSLICEREKEEMTADFGARVAEIIKKNKYRRRYDGVISGVGTKWLP
jgi:hypothetical protein